MDLDIGDTRRLFTNLIRADKFGKMMYSRMMQGKLIGFYHPAEGAIAPGVAAGSFLTDDDILFPHHRGHGITHMLSKGIDVKPYIAEHAGKSTGCCAGRAAWHYAFPEHNVFGTTAYIGHNFVPCTGFGWAAKRNGRGQVVMNCFGDGAMGTGRSHEGLLLSSNWQLPIVHFCENNGLSIFAEVEEMHPTEHLSTVAQGLNIPHVIVEDGQDVFAIAEAVIPAIQRARSGGGPTFIEAKCLRFKEHDIGNRDLRGWTPREESEYTAMLERDPVKVATKRVLEESLLPQSEIDQIHEQAEREVDEAVRFADESPVESPLEAELLADVYPPKKTGVV